MSGVWDVSVKAPKKMALFLGYFSFETVPLASVRVIAQFHNLYDSMSGVHGFEFWVSGS